MNVQHRVVDGPLGAITSNNLSQGSTSITDQSVKKKEIGPDYNELRSSNIGLSTKCEVSFFPHRVERLVYLHVWGGTGG